MALRGREFIFYWITVKEQISTQARKSNCSERNCLFESLPFLSSFVCLIKVFFLAKLVMVTPKMLHRSQGMAAWIPSQEVLIDNSVRAGTAATNMNYT